MCPVLVELTVFQSYLCGPPGRSHGGGGNFFLVAQGRVDVVLAVLS